MTTLAPSMNFRVDECGFVLVFCLGWLVERTVLDSDCHVGLCEGDSFILQESQV